MKSVIVDTGPLVALMDTRDGLHERAVRELDLIRKQRVVELPVLTEAHFFLAKPALRARLVASIERGAFVVSSSENEKRLRYAQRWLAEYADHSPDFADAWIVASADLNQAAVWTFDSEFKSVWRTLDGKRLKLVP